MQMNVMYGNGSGKQAINSALLHFHFHNPRHSFVHAMRVTFYLLPRFVESISGRWTLKTEGLIRLFTNECHSYGMLLNVFVETLATGNIKTCQLGSKIWWGKNDPSAHKANYDAECQPQCIR